MITPELKDRVLSAMVNTGHMNIELFLLEFSASLNIEMDVLDAILSNFERLNICSVHRCFGGKVNVMLHAEAHDMVRLGGFTAQDELLKKNIEKLLLELESLKPNFPERAERISGIIGGISAALSLFIRQ